MLSKKYTADFVWKDSLFYCSNVTIYSFNIMSFDEIYFIAERKSSSFQISFDQNKQLKLAKIKQLHAQKNSFWSYLFVF